MLICEHWSSNIYSSSDINHQDRPLDRVESFFGKVNRTVSGGIQVYSRHSQNEGEYGYQNSAYGDNGLIVGGGEYAELGDLIFAIFFCLGPIIGMLIGFLGWFWIGVLVCILWLVLVLAVLFNLGKS
jgi:hypothetical protein